MYCFQFVFERWKECAPNLIEEVVLQMQSSDYLDI